MQYRMASGVGASSSKRQPSPPHPEEEEKEESIIYSYAPKVASTLDVTKSKTLVSRYQIPSEFRPRLPEEGKCCCSHFSSFGVYTSYFLAGLKFPLNSFCRDLFHRLGMGPN